MSLFPVMVSSQLKEDYSLEVNKTIIYSAAGGRIEAVTSSPHSMEGNRPTLVIRNETQWWVDSNDGHDLAGVIEGNVTKIPGARILSICNAHIPGDDSVAERDYDAWQAVQSGQAVDVGTLYDALEAPADTPVSEIPSEREDPEGYAAGLAKLREGIEIARGDSVWLPVDSIIESVLDVRNPVTESRRKFLNQVNASEDSWIAPYEWDAISDTEARLVKGDRITLGFDGSKSNDWTALVACRVEDGCLFLVKAWNPAKYPSEEVPREDVDATVRSMFESYDVLAFRADVREFEAYVDQWGRDFKKRMKVNASPNNPVAFDMRGQTKRFSFDCERFLDAVIEQEVTHDGNLTLRQHVLNAKRYPTNFDAISIRKASKDSSRKIDAAVCAVLAYGARHDFLMSKRNRSRKAVVLK
jgi:phage terminase large subunit-like protein